MFTGSKVIFGCIDEGNPEVEHQIDDQRTGILCQEDLKRKYRKQDSMSQSCYTLSSANEVCYIFLYLSLETQFNSDKPTLGTYMYSFLAFIVVMLFI